MNIVILIIVAVVGAKWVQSKHAGTSQSGNWAFLGHPAQNSTNTPKSNNAPLVTNTPITEAAFNQDASIKYTPAFGSCEINYEGQEYIL
jgi:hypothetical protein